MEQKRLKIYYLIEAVYAVIIFAFMLTLKSIYSSTSAYDFMTFIFMSFFVVGIVWLCGPRFNKIIGLILTFLYTLYLVSQKIYYRGFDQYYRFNTAFGLSGEVKDVGGAIKELIKFEDIMPFVVLLIIFLVFEFLFLFFQRKIKTKKIFQLSGLIPVIIGVLKMIINLNNINATQYAFSNFDVYKSEYYIYNHVLNTNQFVDKFGLLTFLYRDLEMTILPETNSKEDIQEINDYFDELNINPNSVNEMTGMFKDKSLLIIQAESLNLAAISPELTPNIYRYMNEGINISGFNTPLLIGSTSDTEFMANTSIIPETTGFPVCYEYIENEYPVTLGNMFANDGYNCRGYHNNYAEYYNRNIAFEKYGYDFFDSYKLGLENLSPDTDLSESIGWISCEDEKFLGYWISYSGHQPYNYFETGVSQENIDAVKSIYPDLDEEYVSYLAKNMDFDKALGNFVKVMEWSGRYDDFVIIVYGDHRVKGLDLSSGTNFDRVVGVNSDDNPKIYNTPLFIWAPNIKHIEVDKPCTSLDLLPTIANLWDIDYDRSKVFGHDIFDDNYHGFRFNAEGDYLTLDFDYKLSNDELKILNKEISEEEARKEILSFDRIKEICNKILVNDYFATKEGE